MPRILLIHASVGSGHKRAAQALAIAFRRRQPGQVEVVDVLDYAHPLFRETYARSYVQMTDKMPGLWGYVYEQTDQDIFRYTSDIRAIADQVATRGLQHLIARLQPNVIVCTHFLPVEVLAARKGRVQLDQPLYCVLTDYAAHRFWSYRNVDGYFVATEQTCTQLAERGVPPALIRVYGIPIDPVVMEPKTRAAMRSAHHLPDDKEPVIVLFGGGLATHHVRTILLGLIDLELRATVVVVAGRNQALVSDLQDLPGSAALAIRTLGFVSYVDDLIVAADLVIT
jgi:processive 1,2-diacylglycerol beta-glucosyltransferase